MGARDRSNLPPIDGAALVDSETLAALQPHDYPAGAVLFRPGDADDVLYIVLSGEIALVEDLDTSDERVLQVRGAGGIIGEMAVFSKHTLEHRLSGRALSDTQVLAVPRTEVDALLRREPLLAYELLRIASTHIHRAHKFAMRELETKNTQLERVNEALRAAQAQLLEHERLQHELRLAREIQESMLPTELLQVAGASLGARIIPAREVGGDFFDLFMLDDETLGFVIGDVCGKSVPAALYMAESRSLLRASASASITPAEVLLQVNRNLLALNSGSMFVTAVYGHIHISTGEAVVARAGHEYPLLFAANGSVRKLPRSLGHPLGLLEEPAIDMQELVLDTGDTLLLFTDGVTEAATGDDFFGRERLVNAVRATPCNSAQSLCDHVVRELELFVGDAPQADDITLLALRAT